MRSVAILVVCVLVCRAAVAADPAAKTLPVLPRFDGKSFAGWEGNLQAFRIQDAAIVGGQLDKPVPRNEYLCTTKDLTMQILDDSPATCERAAPLIFSSFRGNGEDGLHLAWSQDGYQVEDGPFPVSHFTPEDWRKHRWGYYRMLELVDQEIGRVLVALRKAGLEEDTLIVFTSDHGECAGAHGFNQKTVFYEESARVPLIVAWKGKTSPGTCDKLVNTGIDIVPTLLAAAGLESTKELPGRSLLPLALSEPAGDAPRV